MRLIEMLDPRMEAFQAAMERVTADFMANPSLCLFGVREINHGKCWDWAMAVESEFYETQEKDFHDDLTVEDCDELGHYFIRFRGLAYDAECPGGVEDPFDLPLAERIGVQVDTSKFKQGDALFYHPDKGIHAQAPQIPISED